MATPGLAVALVARHYWPRPGAATVRLQALVRELRGRGHDVTVYTARSDACLEPVTGPVGEKVVPLPGDKATGVGLGRLLGLGRFALASRRRLRGLRPDVVVSDPPPTSGLAALTTGAPMVYYTADSWAQMLSEGESRFGLLIARGVKVLESRAFRRSSLVVAVRPNLGALAQAAGAPNVSVEPYGTDLHVFTPQGDRWDDPWGGDLPYFLYAGNYGVVQGAPVFIEAAERLWADGLRFGVVFMGYGSDQPAVDAAAARNPEHFRAYDAQPPETAAAAFRGAVAALSSNIPRPVTAETRLAKALAAAACGCPQVYAGSGLFAQEMSAGDLGPAVPWDKDAVAEAMREVLRRAEEDPEDQRRHREAIAAYAATEFDMSATAARIADEIERLAGVAGSPRG